MNLFFFYVWEELGYPKNCSVCNKFLPKEVNKACLDHLLEKSKYDEIKYLEDNIYLVCGDCHKCKTDGFPKPPHKLAIKEFKAKYFLNKEEYVKKACIFEEEILEPLLKMYHEINREI